MTTYPEQMGYTKAAMKLIFELVKEFHPDKLTPSAIELWYECDIWADLKKVKFAACQRANGLTLANRAAAGDDDCLVELRNHFWHP